GGAAPAAAFGAGRCDGSRGAAPRPRWGADSAPAARGRRHPRSPGGEGGREAGLGAARRRARAPRAGLRPLARGLDAARSAAPQGLAGGGDARRGAARDGARGARDAGRGHGRGSGAPARAAARGQTADGRRGVPERTPPERGRASLRRRRAMNVLVLHGPTLQFLGQRQGDPPGLTLAEVDRRLAEKARALGHVLRTLQSNHEGALVDALWEQRTWADGVVLNPGPLAPGSHVLRAAVSASRMPVVEVLLAPAK